MGRHAGSGEKRKENQSRKLHRSQVGLLLKECEKKRGSSK